MTVTVATMALLAPGPLGRPLTAQTPVPAGFTDAVALTGLTQPTVVSFSSDGRVFVGEKSGLIKVFDSLSDPTASVFADLRTQVYNYWDRGLLGMALDPGFPTRPYVYVLYTRDAVIGGTAPKWGSPGVTSDPCPDPPGGTRNGCIASGRLSRLQASGNVWTGSEHVLVDDWFQQFPSHSMGSIAFGPDGALYASGGDGASWQFVDYGQTGDPPNPNGDPPVPVGGTQTPPTAEGGALRAQDLRTNGDPVGLSGTVIRVDPNTGAALPDNPLFSHSDPNARRIVAYGLRNPFRIAAHPTTRELWVGDVGWREYEEINRVPDPAAGQVRNFGWPCYDGTLRQPGYDAANLAMCENLYAQSGAVTFAHFQYREGTRVVTGETCAYIDSSLSGLAFYQGGNYPSQYNGALFFADYTRRCIWVMPAGTNGVPDPARRATFVSNAAYPVDLKTGPGGDLFYVDIVGGSIRRIRYAAGNQAPRALVRATPTSGRAPLTVAFDASGSSDPEGSTLTFDWDFNGDGTFGDSSLANPTFTYQVNGTYTARLKVTDTAGQSGTATVTITVGNTAPTATIGQPASTLRWRVGQSVAFAGSATDPEDGTLPASALSWSLVMNHCSTPTSCHQHFIQQFAGVSSGTFTAPDHEYPSYLTLTLTATDRGGLQHAVTVRLDPQTVVFTLNTNPSGLQLGFGSGTLRAPANQTVIVGSRTTLSAPSPQTLNGVNYAFSSWSDGGANVHTVTAGTTAATYTATFTATASSLPTGWVSRDIGAVGPAGSASHSGGTFTVKGAGADVWGTADAFHYAYRPMTGNGTIVARVASIAGSQAWTKVGVMIRASTSTGSQHAFMLVSTSKGLSFQRRTTTGGLSTSTTVTGTAPRWVRLVRAGNVITASVSTTGTTWTVVGSATFTMPSAVLVGLGVSSHTTTSLATGTFDNVVVTIPSTLPAGWQNVDVGAVGVKGSASASAGTFTVKGAGADVCCTADAFHYAYRTVSGNATIIARVATVSGTQAWTKAGVMIRTSTAAGSQHAFMMVSTARGLAFQWRTATGGTSAHTLLGAGTAPRWVRLVRAGNVITASHSTNGTTWTNGGSITIAMPANVLVGLAVSSHTTTATATATFDQVSVTMP
jgi:glucose/arabinose dehydrogenase/regulation of enolase protein 1 (concanavalin A-like superfamily)